MSSMSSTQMDDPVVRTIPVVFSSKDSSKKYSRSSSSSSSSSKSKVFLLQYPLRPRQRPYSSDLARLGAKIKPKQTKFVLSFGIDSGSESYDHENETHLQTLNLSSTLVRCKSNYGVGWLKDGQMHITPIDTVLKMRPDLSYLDEADARHKQQLEDAKRREMGVKKALPAQVTQQVARPHAGGLRAKQRINLKKLNEVVSREPWKELHVFDRASEQAKEQKHHLIKPTQNNTGAHTHYHHQTYHRQPYRNYLHLIVIIIVAVVIHPSMTGT